MLERGPSSPIALMAKRKPFLLRLEPETFEAIQRWADDDLRSMNGQVEFVLRRALRDAGRLPGERPRGDRTSTAYPRDRTIDGSG